MIVSQIEQETAGKDNLEVTVDEVLNWLKSKWPHWKRPAANALPPGAPARKSALGRAGTTSW